MNIMKKKKTKRLKKNEARSKKTRRNEKVDLKK